jgi:hypothetical protein
MVKTSMWTLPEPSREMGNMFSGGRGFGFKRPDYESASLQTSWNNARKHDYSFLDTSMNRGDIANSGWEAYSTEPTRRPISENIMSEQDFETLLANISPLNPEAKYEYGPLRPENDEIRLLRLLSNPGGELEGALVTVSLSTLPEFIALSYTWGDRTNPEKMIVNGGWVTIRRNLAAALRNPVLRETINTTNTKAIWVDSICINQQDKIEKGVQVQRMRQIYMQGRTHVWLGEEDESSSIAIALLENLYADRDNLAQASPHITLETTNSLNVFLNRPYWFRAWIIKEYVLGKARQIICGSKSIRPDILHHALSVILRVREKITIDPGILDGINWILRSEAYLHIKSLEALDQLYGSTTVSIIGTQFPLHFLPVLELCRSSLCSNKRDKVFALLGLAVDADEIVGFPDYSKEVSQLYQDVARACIIKYKSLEVLCYADNLGEVHSDNFDLSTWVPDWSSPASATTLSILSRTMNDSFSRYHADTYTHWIPIMHSEVEDLTVWGYEIDSIEYIGEQSTLCTHHLADKEEPQNPEQIENTNAQKKYVIESIIRNVMILHARWADDPALLDQAIALIGNGFSVASESNLYQDGEITGWFATSGHLKFGRRCTLQWIQNIAELTQSKMTENIPGETRSFWEYTVDSLHRDFLESTRGRRLFVTEKGTLGIGRNLIQTKDLVFIIPGCSVPLVLRTNGQKYTLVGDCHVDGWMNGEMIERFSDEEKILKLRRIIIQ